MMIDSEVNKIPFEVYDEVIDHYLGSGERNVFYPGIGGGEESIDLLGGFKWINADMVYGIDEFPYAEENDPHPLLSHYESEEQVLEDLHNISSVSGIFDRSDSEVIDFSFEWSSKSRRLYIPKKKMDMRYTSMPMDYRIIFSKRTPLDLLSSEATAAAELILFIPEVVQEIPYIANHFAQHGFQQIDLEKITHSKNFRKIALLVRN